MKPSNTCHELYQTDAESQEARFRATADGKQNRLDGFDALLDGTFSNPRKDTQRSLKEYAKLSSGIRGIERFTCKPNHEERVRHRRRAFQAIMMAQSRSREKEVSNEQTQEILRDVSVLYSIDAKIFARRLAKADEAAVRRRKRGQNQKNSSSEPPTSVHQQETLLYTIRANAGRSAQKV